MKKLLSMLGAIGLVAASSTTVIACGNKNETNYNDKLIDLSDTKIKKNLELYGEYGQIPSEQHVLEAFNKANGLNLVLDTDVTIATPTIADDDATPIIAKASIIAKAGSKLVKADSKARVTITIIIKMVDLSDTKIKKELELYGEYGQIPSEQHVLEAFNKANGLDLELGTDVTIAIPTIVGETTIPTIATTSIAAIAGSKLVKADSEANVTITIRMADLSDETIETNLEIVGQSGVAVSLTALDVLAAFEKANSLYLELDTDVTIATPTIADPTATPIVGTASIVGKAGSKIVKAGSMADVTITFIKVKLNTLIKSTAIIVDEGTPWENSSWILGQVNWDNELAQLTNIDVTITIKNVYESKAFIATIVGTKESKRVIEGSSIDVNIYVV